MDHWPPPHRILMAHEHPMHVVRGRGSALRQPEASLADRVRLAKVGVASAGAQDVLSRVFKARGAHSADELDDSVGGACTLLAATPPPPHPTTTLVHTRSCTHAPHACTHTLVRTRSPCSCTLGCRCCGRQRRRRGSARAAAAARGGRHRPQRAGHAHPVGSFWPPSGHLLTTF
jgi:hypothetical protein